MELASDEAVGAGAAFCPEWGRFKDASLRYACTPTSALMSAFRHPAHARFPMTEINTFGDGKFS
jgi:hypothetical protein